MSVMFRAVTKEELANWQLRMACARQHATTVPHLIEGYQAASFAFNRAVVVIEDSYDSALKKSTLSDEELKFWGNIKTEAHRIMSFIESSLSKMADLAKEQSEWMANLTKPALPPEPPPELTPHVNGANKRTRRRLTQIEIKGILMSFAEGKPIADIAQSYRCTIDAVQYHIDKATSPRVSA